MGEMFERRICMEGIEVYLFKGGFRPVEKTYVLIIAIIFQNNDFNCHLDKSFPTKASRDKAFDQIDFNVIQDSIVLFKEKLEQLFEGKEEKN